MVISQDDTYKRLNRRRRDLQCRVVGTRQRIADFELNNMKNTPCYAKLQFLKNMFTEKLRIVEEKIAWVNYKLTLKGQDMHAGPVVDKLNLYISESRNKLQTKKALLAGQNKSVELVDGKLQKLIAKQMLLKSLNNQEILTGFIDNLKASLNNRITDLKQKMLKVKSNKQKTDRLTNRLKKMENKLVSISEEQPYVILNHYLKNKIKEDSIEEKQDEYLNSEPVIKLEKDFIGNVIDMVEQKQTFIGLKKTKLLEEQAVSHNVDLVSKIAQKNQ